MRPFPLGPLRELSVPSREPKRSFPSWRSLSNVPAGLSQQTEWRALKVQGPLDLGEIGVLAAISIPLADAGISILMISTFDTDHLLVADQRLQAAILALEKAGHTVQHEDPKVEEI
jgi:hypothetical protein